MRCAFPPCGCSVTRGGIYTNRPPSIAVAEAAVRPDAVVNVAVGPRHSPEPVGFAVAPLSLVAVVTGPDIDAAAVFLAVAVLPLVALAWLVVLVPLQDAASLREPVLAGAGPGDRFLRLRDGVPHPATVARIGDPARLRGLRRGRERNKQQYCRCQRAHRHGDLDLGHGDH